MSLRFLQFKDIMKSLNIQLHQSSYDADWTDNHNLKQLFHNKWKNFNFVITPTERICQQTSIGIQASEGISRSAVECSSLSKHMLFRTLGISLYLADHTQKLFKWRWEDVNYNMRYLVGSFNSPLILSHF